MATKKKTGSKKKSKSAIIPAAYFKLTGANAKLKIDAKKQKLYYFAEKVSPDKAAKMAAETAAEIMEASVDAVKASKPSLKYDFYCIYDAEVQVKYLSVNNQEIGVYDQLLGAMVGGEVLAPKKGKNVPGKAIFVDIAELYETKNKASHILDGTTGFPARSLETMLKGAGKKAATAAWIKKAVITPGKFNSIEKVLKAITKDASKVPAEAKRVVEHTLDFSQLQGFYVPTFYVKVTHGADSKMMRINAVNRNVALKV
ncbi:MAG: hypothetical protein P1Q69_02800 [Candidatus Thorarchaeota archaeon]|nr:hypothetical protein [Candidatus Thorarchaeota archaeon]